MIFQMNLFCMFWGSYMTIGMIFSFLQNFVLWWVYAYIYTFIVKHDKCVHGALRKNAAISKVLSHLLNGERQQS